MTNEVLSDGAANYTPGISERRSSTTKYVHHDRLGSTERLTNHESRHHRDAPAAWALTRKSPTRMRLHILRPGAANCDIAR